MHSGVESAAQKMIAKAARRIVRLLQSSEADPAALPGVARKIADQFD
jgi:hypothetical protein